MNGHTLKLRVLTLAASLLFVTGASATEIIFLGIDIQGPVQQWDTSGTFLGNFGQGRATGTALDGAGSVYTVSPNFGNNRIEQYDSTQAVLNTFISAANGEWIEDMAWGGGNTIWVSTCCSGSVMNIDATTGAVNSAFNAAGGAIMGVAFDGTNLWTTDGLTSVGTNIYQYDTSGVLLNTINTGFINGGGIGYSALTNTLWVGYFGIVRQFDLTGNLFSAPCESAASVT